MTQPKIYELNDIHKVREQDEELFRIVCEQANQTLEQVGALHSIVRQVSERISHEDIPEAKKQLILYRFLSSLYSTVISYTLTIDGAIAVCKSVLEGFETTKSLMEHEKEKKSDQFYMD